MNFSNLNRIYNTGFNTPLEDILAERNKKNHPGKSPDGQKKEFFEEYWCKLSEEEQKRLIKTNEDFLDKEKALMEKELREAFSSTKKGLAFYNDVAEKAYNYLIAKNPNKDYGEMPQASFTSDEERAKREKTQKKALDISIRLHIDRINEGRRSKSYSFINGTLDSVPRECINLCRAYFKDGKRCENEAFEKVIYTKLPTDEKEKEKLLSERKEILDTILKDLLDFTKKLRKPMTDDEYLDQICDDKFHYMFQGLAEIGLCNFKSIVATFGVEPSPEIKDEWFEMADEIVGAGGFIGRLGYLANPLYTEIANPMEAYNVFNFLSEQSNFIDAYDYANAELGLGEEAGDAIFTYQDVVKLREKGPEKGPTFNVKGQAYNHISFMANKETIFDCLGTGKIYGLLGEMYGIKPKNILLKDVFNNELEDKGAFDNLFDDKKLKIYDKENNRFIGVIEAGNFDKNNGTLLRDPVVPEDLKVGVSKPEELAEVMKDIQKEISACTRWYMRSSSEFRGFRKAIDKLTDEKIYENPEEAKKCMKEAADFASKYLKRKNSGKEKITSITEQRMAVASKYADILEYSANDNAPVINQFEEKEPIREQVSIKEADTKQVQKVDEKAVEKQARVEKVEEKTIE